MKWNQRFRFVFVGTRVKKQRKGPVQLDLFIPYGYGYEFKVMVTNKTVQIKTALGFHNGRGSQEGIFAKLKPKAHMGYVPVELGSRINYIFLQDCSPITCPGNFR